MTGRATSATREILRNAGRFRGLTVLVAPSGIGPIERDDLGMFLQDADLMTKLGMRVILGDLQGEDFWAGLEVPASLSRLQVPNEEELITAAVKYGVTRLCLVAGTDRITTGKGQQLDDMPLAAAEELLAGDALTKQESRRALARAVSACRAGVSRVHIFNVHRDGALLEELFTDRGVGTMIHAGAPHKETRVMVDDDLHSVSSLLRDAVPRRTFEFVREHRRELRVFTVDNDVHGVARISRRKDTLLVLTLAHSSRSDTAEVLASLLRAALNEAREQGAATVAVPVDEIPALMRILPWFTGLGFKKGRIDLGASEQDAWLKNIA